MRKRGHRLLLCAPSNAKIFREAQGNGFETISFSDSKPRYPLSLVRLAIFFKRNGVDVVNTHSSRDGWLCGAAAKLAGVPALIRSRHIEVDYPNRLTSRAAFYHMPDKVLTTSEKIRERLCRELSIPESHVLSLPTGIDTARFNPSVTCTLREEIGIPCDKPLIGMISVIRSWKGHRHFLDAAKLLLQSGRQAAFVIAGDGPGREELRENIRLAGLENDLFYLGHRDDVPEILASLNALVLPSIAHEGVPQIILQAQAIGIPVVGSTVGGIPEVVSDGETGLLVPPGDPAAIASAIGRLLNSQELSERVTKNALKKIMESHTVGGMCARLEGLYADLLASSCQMSRRK